MLIIATIITLSLIMCLCPVVWVLDARQQRINRQLAIAMPASPTTTNAPSLRRQQSHSRWRSVHRLLKYDSEAVYDIAPPYVVCAGIIAALADLYVGSFAGLSLVYTALGAVITAVLTVRGLFGWQQHRFRNRLFRQLPDVVEMVTSTVRAGLPIVEAFQVIAREMSQPTAGQFALVCDEVSFGSPPEQAMENVYQRTKVAEYGMFAVTLAVQLKAGGSLAETLQTLGNTVRQRVALAARAKALAGEVIFSARALSLSPFVVGGLLYLISPQSVDKLFTDPTGRLLLAYSGTSVLMGVLTIRWMIKKETSI